MKKIILCLSALLLVGCSSHASKTNEAKVSNTETTIEMTTELLTENNENLEVIATPRKNLAENINTKDLRKLILDCYKATNIEVKYDSSGSNKKETYYNFYEYYNGLIVEPICITVHIYNDEDSDVTIQGIPVTDIDDTDAICAKSDFILPTGKYSINEAQNSIKETTLYFGDCYYYDDNKIYYCYIFETDSNTIIIDANNLENHWNKEII